MLISASKTKCMTTSKTPLRCMLVVNDQIIHRVTKFKYLGIEISGFGDVENEVREQTTKTLRIAACLNENIWRNKHIGIEAKSRIYKATVRPIMTYTVETRPETAKTKRMMETAEMKVLRRIAGKTLLDRDVNEWVLSRKKWNEHMSRMDNNRLVKIVGDKSPLGRRSTRRPRSIIAAYESWLVSHESCR
ncbi:uncharacterized protein LOC130449023 [Diorhabda sublineata]|uniref:uncharacterized protein LOC130449023 n=1 Tax=Diorhabda sublineata TaxID=1163346 RepID=UPI0024E0BDCC|nr:uncharacterized protein LOC130449023 [Diorhabda sublineata]